ncbi:hypothetical protein [Ferrovibrio xuzhouensis]|uniref:Phage holin family protein n=1 Tax=Ferrovibrio xuzhouensis TaxID=1576914 RepID=A0ABV7VJH8_9PROT
MSLNLASLAFQGLQAAASARQRRQIAVAAVAGLFGLAAMLAGLLMAGWALFLGFSAVLIAPWAAAAAAACLFVLAGLSGCLVLRLKPEPVNPLNEAIAQIAPLVRQHPTTALLAAAVLGGLTGLSARR